MTITMIMTIAAVDPGLKGSVVLIDMVTGHPTKLSDMPVVKEGSKKVVDVAALADLLRVADVVVVEQVGASPRQGVSSAFSFGGSFMAVRGVAAGLGIPCHTITPQKWKTLLGFRGKPKDAVREAALARFPEFESTFKFKKSVDKADALYLGLAWRKLNK